MAGKSPPLVLVVLRHSVELVDDLVHVVPGVVPILEQPVGPPNRPDIDRGASLILHMLVWVEDLDVVEVEIFVHNYLRTDDRAGELAIQVVEISTVIAEINHDSTLLIFIQLIEIEL